MRDIPCFGICPTCDEETIVYAHYKYYQGKNDPVPTFNGNGDRLRCPHEV